MKSSTVKMKMKFIDGKKQEARRIPMRFAESEEGMRPLGGVLLLLNPKKIYPYKQTHTTHDL